MKTQPNLPPVFQAFEQQQKQKKKTRDIFKWFIGISVMLFAIPFLTDENVFSGLCIFLIGLLLLPPIIPFIENKIRFKIRPGVKYAVIILLFFVSVISNKSPKSTTHPSVSNETLKKDDNKSKTTPLEYQYTILKKEDNNSFQNFSILLKPTDTTKDIISRIAVELKGKLCKGRCNITLYDSKVAYDMEIKLNEAERYLGDKLSTGNISTAKYKDLYLSEEKKYYVIIADHLLGSIMIDSDDFEYYPLRDWHYKELGGKKIDKIRATTEVVTNHNNNEKREEKIKHIFSAWDGSAIKLALYVKKNMNDPDSFEHIETNYSDKGNSLVVVMKYRGKNAFGAKVVNYIKAKINLEGDVLEIISDGE